MSSGLRKMSRVIERAALDRAVKEGGLSGLTVRMDALEVKVDKFVKLFEQILQAMRKEKGIPVKTKAGVELPPGVDIPEAMKS